MQLDTASTSTGLAFIGIGLLIYLIGRTRGNQRNLRAFFRIIVPTTVGAAAVALWYPRVVLGICAGMGLLLLAKPYIEDIAQAARVIH